MHDGIPARCRRGFTLLELLVALAVVGVVLTTSATITSHALSIHRTARSRLDAERTASTVCGQLRGDLAARVRRAEAPVRFTKRPGNDTLTLLTARRGIPLQAPTADRRVTIASYRVADHRLERAAAGLAFGDDPAARPSLDRGTLALLEFPAEGPEPPADDAFQPLAPAVFRLELSFLLTGTNSKPAAQPPADPADVAAVVVTLATLDPARRRMLDDAQLERLAGRFPDAADGSHPAGRWSEAAASLVRELPDFPREPLQRVRVHQAVYPIPPDP